MINNQVAELYKEHGAALLRYAARKVPSRQTSQAEDVVQETFLRITTHLRNGRPIDFPRGLLFTIARNLIYTMFYRSPVNKLIDPIPEEVEFEADASKYSPECLASSSQQFNMFSNALEQLPELYRQAFLLRRVFGESCRDISKIMGLSESVVQNHAAKGCMLLRKYCAEHNITLDNY